MKIKHLTLVLLFLAFFSCENNKDEIKNNKATVKNMLNGEQFSVPIENIKKDISFHIMV